MDPLTAILQLIAELTKLVTVVVDSQPPEVRAELWRLHLEDVKAWRAFLERFRPQP